MSRKGPANSNVQVSNNTTRHYDSNGNADIDYDRETKNKPDHMHLWNDGVRDGTHRETFCKLKYDSNGKSIPTVPQKKF